MKAIERPTFETAAAKAVYQYVERHGTAQRDRIRAATKLGREEFEETLESLLSKGYLAADGSVISLALDVGSVENHATGSYAYAIRPARQADFDSLVETIREVSAGSDYVVAESIAEQLLYEDAIVRHNTVESRVFFLAAIDDEVVGWCHLDLPQLEGLRGTAHLTVGVRPEFQEHGIGSQLLERGTDWARANGYRKLYNVVPATAESALSFLASHGWQTESIRRNHYTVDGETVDEVTMSYAFD